MKNLAYIIFAIVFTFIFNTFCGCTNNNDWIRISPVPMDSMQTEQMLDNILSGGYINLYDPERDVYLELTHREDLRYVPYLYIMFSDKFIPNKIATKHFLYFQYYIARNTDTLLFNIGKKIFDALCYKNRFNPGCIKHEDNDIIFIGKNGPRFTYSTETGVGRLRFHHKEHIGGKLYDIDSLRLRVVAYGDRNSLEMLEKYYTGLNQPKELAIYYKVMLGYEGNGDLAEKYYLTLKPYLANKPAFINSLRETLLRAALCDNNARAQQLCDSLGFSLCDYRLTPIE